MTKLRILQDLSGNETAQPLRLKSSVECDLLSVPLVPLQVLDALGRRFVDAVASCEQRELS